MDAAMASMMGMDMGMDGATNVMFEPKNAALAASYWYIIAGVLGFTAILRVVDFLQSSIRLRLSRSRAFQYPTQPRNLFWQKYATATTIVREISAPELYINSKWLSWLSPPSLGRSVVLLSYWAVIIYMLTADAVVLDPYYFERIAFRAAWISATQIPFVFLLASKSSIIGFLSGSSYERLNWLHRWASRTMMVTVTLHGGFFWTEWIRADFVALEIMIMPMVKYGLGAWFVLLWTFVSSLAPIRQLSYELFVLQHLAAACVFLWLLWVHMPSYAQYNIWFAISALVFDKAFMLAITLWTNINLRYSKKIGHTAEISTPYEGVTQVMIHDVSMTWTAGQHIYLRLPLLGPLEAHPFTIANVHHSSKSGSNSIQLLIKAKTGFTRRIHKRAFAAPYSTPAILTGPFGRPPSWNSFETLILISASTGSSFTLPILDSALARREGETCVSRIDVLMIVRNRKHITHYLPRLNAAVTQAQQKGMALNITIAITCPCDHAAQEAYETEADCNTSDNELAVCKCGNKVRSEVLTRGRTAIVISSRDFDSDNGSFKDEKDAFITSVRSRPNSKSSTDDYIVAGKPSCCSPSTSSPNQISEATTIQQIATSSSASTNLTSSSNESLTYTIGTRPNVANFIRGPVEASGGETCVAVCGGRLLVAETRNFVARLSDERAVHKGSGAQGIEIYSEGFCY